MPIRLAFDVKADEPMTQVHLSSTGLEAVGKLARQTLHAVDRSLLVVEMRASLLEQVRNRIGSVVRTDPRVVARRVLAGPYASSPANPDSHDILLAIAKGYV